MLFVVQRQRIRTAWFWRHGTVALMDGELSFSQNNSDLAQIKWHLEQCDQLFIPPLSERVVLSEYAAKLSDRGERFEAWMNKTLVGLVAAYANNLQDRIAYVTSVSVLPEFQGANIAGRLLTSCARFAESRGFRRLALEVHGSNSQVIKLYHRMGFTTSREQGQMLLMAKCLS